MGKQARYHRSSSQHLVHLCFQKRIDLQLTLSCRSATPCPNQHLGLGPSKPNYKAICEQCETITLDLMQKHRYASTHV